MVQLDKKRGPDPASQAPSPVSEAFSHGRALFTDFYQLTMGAAYLHAGVAENRASFELFVRQLPRVRSYMVFAGLAQVLDYLVHLRFTGREIAYLRRHPALAHAPRAFFQRLENFRFSGDVWALPEGMPAFAGEPLLRIEAPLLEAQLVETYLLSMINFQTSVATKAARLVQAARGRPIMEFGTRRAHTAFAGLYGARAAYLGGCSGTSNVAAGVEFGIPVGGTFAHSYVLAFASEQEAFRNYAETFQKHATLLIDTYDVAQGAELAARLQGPVRALRLDSGNALPLSRQMRGILNRAGRRETQIMLSGDLNEYRIEDLVRLGAPLDSFGVGTELITSIDAPALGGVYKLVEIERQGRTFATAKFSSDKITLPGRKQIYRYSSRGGQYRHDWLGLQGEAAPARPDAECRPLLRPVMRAGRLLPAAGQSLEQARQLCREQLAKLPARYRRLVDAGNFPVRISPRLRALQQEVKRRRSEEVKSGAGGETGRPQEKKRGSDE